MAVLEGYLKGKKDEKDGDNLFSRTSCDKTRGNGFKPKGRFLRVW